MSVSPGVDALASAFTALTTHKLPIGIVHVSLLIVGNMRGVREAGAIFALTTYLFIVSLLLLIAACLVQGLLVGARWRRSACRTRCHRPDPNLDAPARRALGSAAVIAARVVAIHVDTR